MHQTEFDLQSRKPLELYIHIPFCVKKCDYCDFLSAPSDYQGRKAYTEALCREITSTLKETAVRPVKSLFIGGGTPSILEPELMDQILTAVSDTFSFTGDAELTIEANPGTLTREKLELYRKHGINRLSLGLQSTYEDDLRMLGRIHTFADFERSFHLAREAGFANINVDLMSAIPGQTRERWEGNLERVAAMQPEHISAYSLIVEEGTPFAARELDLPDEDAEYEMYEDTGRILGAYGYQQYEISNYAREGRACRHNIGYWRREDYLGFGLGASSFVDGVRFSNTPEMKQYLKCADTPSDLRENEQILSKEEAMEEFMFLGLRMTEGISETEFQTMFGENMMQKYGEVLLKYEKSGHLLHEEDRWKFSREGIHVSNWILADFLD